MPQFSAGIHGRRSMEIPRVMQAARAGRAECTTTENAEARPMNILVVDDERTLRRTIRTALESMGHHVAEAGTQGESLAAIDREPFDLILLDLRLGSESGLDVLRAILEASPGQGVVVITAYASVDTAVEAMRRGALDY